MTRSRPSTSCAPRRASTGGASSSPATVSGRSSRRGSAFSMALWRAWCCSRLLHGPCRKWFATRRDRSSSRGRPKPSGSGRPGPPSGVILGAPVSYWLDLRSYFPLEAARSLGRPLLILQGERDYQVSMADFAGWKKELGGRPGVALKSHPTLNHLFAAGEGRSTPAEYEKPGHVAAEVVEDIAAFVKKSPPAPASRSGTNVTSRKPAARKLARQAAGERNP